MKLPRCLMMLAAASTMLLLAGCHSGMYPVRGTITFDDGQQASQLAGGFVTFQSVDGQVSSQGAIQPDGSFRLSTQSENDGALPGRYRVLVTPPPHHGDERQQAIPLVDPQYSDPRTSTLEATVEERANEVQLRVKRARR
jgi:hypothetical protein